MSEHPAAAQFILLSERFKVVSLGIFASCARLSSALRHEGFHATSFDVKPVPGSGSVKCDLLTSSGRGLVWQLLRSGKVCCAHMAPPCSTTSAKLLGSDSFVDVFGAG